MGACVTKSDPKVESIMSLETDEVEMQKSAQELRQSYEITTSCKILGAGEFGKVFLSRNRADPTLQVAIKLYNKSKLKGRDSVKRIREEVKILTTLDHPNIVKYY